MRRGERARDLGGRVARIVDEDDRVVRSAYGRIRRERLLRGKCFERFAE